MRKIGKTNRTERIGKSKAALKIGKMVDGLYNLALAQSAIGFITPSLFRDTQDKHFYKRYKEKKYKRFNELKGGNKQMETKSRYEVIAELEEKKRSLILDRDALGDNLKIKQRNLRDLKRELEDRTEETKEYEDSLKEQKETINELIKSVDESLNRFANIGNNKKS